MSALRHKHRIMRKKQRRNEGRYGRNQIHTRRNVGRIFDFEQDRIKPDGLHEGWQTGGTVRITRLAFNLWNGYTEQGEERMSTPYEMFDCSFAPYFYEAIKLRYPEYCRELPTGRTQADGAERGGR